MLDSRTLELCLSAIEYTFADKKARVHQYVLWYCISVSVSFRFSHFFCMYSGYFIVLKISCCIGIITTTCTCMLQTVLFPDNSILPRGISLPPLTLVLWIMTSMTGYHLQKYISLSIAQEWSYNISQELSIVLIFCFFLCFPYFYSIPQPRPVWSIVFFGGVLLKNTRPVVALWA